MGIDTNVKIIGKLDVDQLVTFIKEEISESITTMSKKLKIHILSSLMAKRYFSAIIGVKLKICYTIS